MSNITTKGLKAGLFMSITLFFILAAGYTGGESITYLKYVPLAIILGVYFNALSSDSDDFYKYALGNGLQISVIAGMLIALFNIAVFMIEPSMALSKYNLVPTSITGAMAVSGVLLFEVSVFGMIITFTMFQAFKNRNVDGVQHIS